MRNKQIKTKFTGADVKFYMIGNLLKKLRVLQNVSRTPPKRAAYVLI